MIIKDFKQGTLEWQAARVGMPSASLFKKIVTSDGSRSKNRQQYLYQLAAERIAKYRDEIYQTVAMCRGIELEDEARNRFIFDTGLDVYQVGMCVHDSGLFSCSPDGLILEDKGLEIKCPSMAVHAEYLDKGRVPPEYYQQVHGSMLVTGFEEWFFMSYCPGLKPFILLEKRDDAFCAKLENELTIFCKELEELTERIR